VTKSETSTQAEIVDGGAAFFRTVFDTEYDYVHHSLRRLGVDQRDLEDVAHEVFVEVYKNLGRYDRARPIKPWLFAFAFRFASDYRRLARHRTELGLPDDEATSHAPSAEDRAVEREAAQLVAAALHAMPIDQRAVFLLYELDEIPMKQIAESLGIAVNTAYSRLRLAREVFAAHAETNRDEAASEKEKATAKGGAT
jgi:RNA polymerase sigma-70 factor (ECF subfamily)